MAPERSYYETDALLAQYLAFHYAPRRELLPHRDGPVSAFAFPVRVVSENLDVRRLPRDARALDLGCAVGRSSFELARHCTEVVGIDLSQRFIDAATRLRRRGNVGYRLIEEWELTVPAVARVPKSIRRERVAFEVGDATALRADLGSFDVVVISNLLDRLNDPRRCLRRLSSLVRPGGQLIITSPFTWLESFTPRSRWLGGFLRNGRPVRSFDTLRELLADDFRLVRRRDMPFLIREHRRKFQWTVADATIWRRA